MANRQRTGRTDGADKRGNSRDRAARRAWILLTFGDGTSAPCALTLVGSCAGTVTNETMEVDRIIPGAQGGPVHTGQHPSGLPAVQRVRRPRDPA